jgi:hypothetical protein
MQDDSTFNPKTFLNVLKHKHNSAAAEAESSGRLEKDLDERA